MTIETTGIDGLLIIRPQRFGDDRGYFAETFRASNLGKHPPDDAPGDESKSRKAVLRGLHFQAPPHAQQTSGMTPSPSGNLSTARCGMLTPEAWPVISFPL